MTKSCHFTYRCACLFLIAAAAMAQEIPNDPAQSSHGSLATGASIERSLMTRQPAPTTVTPDPNGDLFMNSPSPFTTAGVLLQAHSGFPNMVAKLGTADSTSAFVVDNFNNVELFRIQADGSVGIGTVGSLSNGSRLTLKNTGGQMFQLWDVGVDNHYRTQEVIYAAASDTLGLFLGINQDAVQAQTLYFTNGAAFVVNGKSAPLYLGTANTPRVTVDATGNVGIGTTTPSQKLDVNGAINVNGNATFSGVVTGGNIQAKYQDVAEWVPAEAELPNGTVVVVRPDRDNEVVASTRAYDTSVAGVVSPRPGITLGEAAAGKVLIATTGRVRVRVDASRMSIRAGDILVTSDVPGTAMKSEPIEVAGVKIHRPGTIIGKALEPLNSGNAEILVLLSLQ